MKSTIYLVAIPGVLLVSFLSNAQTAPSPEVGNLLNQVNGARAIQQPGGILDPNSGSEQFFQQGRDQLHFLPTEKSQPILQIDEGVEQTNPRINPRKNPQKLDEVDPSQEEKEQ
ncbi:MAG: hypothetical protein HC930_14900 [Hydrococcus sp. SU_1_0]|nr:hypothetical protein [Hydrococcus sp. SU_1_0]